jgi:dTDP-4-dehydrorhamnose reductase
MNRTGTTWITGATGLLGRAILAEFAAAYEGDFVGTGLSRASGKVEKLDLLDRSAVEAFFETKQPKFIIHSAAERKPDVSEKDPEAAWTLNVDTTEHLAKLCHENGAWLLYLSTDYVFDGTAPPYQPGDDTNPLNYYGKSKLAGEDVIQKVSDNFGILRVPILYGEIEHLGESAVTSVALDLKGSPTSAQDDWAIRYPTHVKDVALLCRQMVEQRSEDEGFRGIFHWSGNEPFTKYQMACIMSPVLGISRETVTADTEPATGTPRPQDCCLESTLLESLAFGRQRSFADAIVDILKRTNLKDQSS